MNGREELAQAGDLTADRVMNSEFIFTTETAPIEAVAQLLVEHEGRVDRAKALFRWRVRREALPARGRCHDRIKAEPTPA
jgi:hypothetical protein